ncbi:hypothetical protein FOMG_18587 [Fusarium oxysporum f. sp. melonis 26406]|uniref:Uncharacterized protein n=1 Tax=Fusarium oxysporum f. sp. melonis 26406 TaxID=1089452 RepID=W9ZUC1_FUSOX|nr:hypothetical protein FOMG_18587 [Fusarium oxysporum f. sp. melonis 26406]
MQTLQAPISSSSSKSSTISLRMLVSLWSAWNRITSPPESGWLTGPHLRASSHGGKATLRKAFGDHFQMTLASGGSQFVFLRPDPCTSQQARIQLGLVIAENLRL